MGKDSIFGKLIPNRRQLNIENPHLIGTPPPTRRSKDMRGERFGRLLIISYSHTTKDGNTFWVCICDCGKEKKVSTKAMRGGHSVSCGCYNEEKKKTHGLTNTRIYRIWRGMLQRCLNSKSQYFEYYGGRGITVCEPWLIFINFYNDMYGTYKEELTIDRINANGNYEPTNCKWATRQEQQQNKRDTIRLTIHGQKGTIREWSLLSGTPGRLIQQRYFKKWSHFECVYGKKIEQTN